jgi:hypothetical protein
MRLSEEQIPHQDPPPAHGPAGLPDGALTRPLPLLGNGADRNLPGPDGHTALDPCAPQHRDFGSWLPSALRWHR